MAPPESRLFRAVASRHPPRCRPLLPSPASRQTGNGELAAARPSLPPAERHRAAVTSPPRGLGECLERFIRHLTTSALNREVALLRDRGLDVTVLTPGS